VAEALPAEPRALCRLDEIADGGSAAYEPMIGGRPRRLLAVRQGRRVFVYENRCPHLGWPLDIVPGRFLAADGRHILCTGHGALFRIADGHCVKGPCLGQALTPVKSCLAGDRVVILV
jgi:nitrite reductase/ring-hydroxylating ferredoxin subunit